MARQPSSRDAALTGFATSPLPGTVRLQRAYPGPPEHLWAHLTESVKRREWWADGGMDLRRNGPVQLTWHFSELSPFEETPARFETGGKGHTQFGRVTRVEPPRLLAFTWGEDSEVMFELTARGEDTVLVITHRRLDGRPEMIRIASGWFTHMLLLEDVLLGRERRPFWHNFTLAQHEHEKLLGEPALTIRVSRRFKARPEQVFDAWLGARNVPLWMFANGPDKLVHAESDPRPGGGFLYIDRQDGEDIEHTGSYIACERPRRIVFTFGIPDFSSEVDRVTLDVTPFRGGCEVVLVHEMKPVWEEYSDRAEAGWLRILRNIAAAVEA